MDLPKSVAPPTRLSAISQVGKVVVVNSTFNLDQRNANQSQSSVDDIRQIPDWLTLIDFRSVQNDMFSKHTIGTGTWFVEHDKFQNWVSSETSVLWVKGLLGAGKTILSSIVINHLETSFPDDQGDTAIIFAYCRHSDRYSSTDILASFVKQLAQRHSGVLSLVESVYMNHCEDGTPPRHEELLDILQKSIPLFNRVYMIIDAWDEFPDDARDDFLKALVSLPARLLLTSRPTITSYLLEGEPYIEMGDENQKDIEFFIDQKFEESTSLKILFRQNERIWSQLRARLKETSRGMFLIAPFQIESLKSCTTVNELREAAESLSPDINDTYSSTWERIKAQSEKGFSLARRAIIWLAYARRPLTISELQHALAVQRGAEIFDDDDVAAEETILSVCCGLIVMDRESQIVHFVHLTVLDFFKNLGRSVHPTPHTLITESCLSYLQAFQLTRCGIISQKELKAFLNVEGRPLLDYAYRYWGCHTRSCYEEDGLPHAVSAFLEKCGQYPCLVNGTDFDLFKRPHVVAYYGLRDISSSGNAKCNRLTPIMEFTPFILACAQGNEENVKKLLSCKADVNTHAKNGYTALYAASLNGHEAVVGLLLSRNEVAINTQTKDTWRVRGSGFHMPVVHKVAVKTRMACGHAALFAAASKGNEAVVKLLLSHEGIYVNTLMKDDQTVLCAAANNGHKAVVELLLSRPEIEVNTQTKGGWTALSAASSNGHKAVVELLLNRTDIEVNTQTKGGWTKGGWTALSAASNNGHEAVVNLLLSHPDIKVNKQTKSGCTALYAASNNGHEAVVNLLLSHPDIKVNKQTKSGCTALYAASNNDHEAVIELLLPRTDIAVNTQTKAGWTALSSASRCGHEAVVRFLLSHPDIEVNTQTNDGRTALYAASDNGHETVVELLLSHPDIAVNTQTEEESTAIYAAFKKGHTEVAKLLMSHKDIIICAQTKEGQTGLRAAIRGKALRMFNGS